MGRYDEGWSVTVGLPGPGRGAYVCPDQACRARFTENSRLEKVLKARFTNEERNSLRDQLVDMAIASGQGSHCEEG